MSKNSLLNSAAERLELPSDIVQGALRIDMLGREHLRVVNHRGIAQFTPERVVIRGENGLLCVKGAGLTMFVLTNEQLTVDGRIDSLIFGEHSDEI